MSAALVFKLRIVAGHVALQAVRPQASLGPDAMHGVFTDAQRRGQLTAAPVRGTIAGFLASGPQNAGAQKRGQHPGALAGMMGIEAIQTGCQEPLLPTNDRRSCGLQPLLDRAKGRTVGQHQDQLGAEHVSCRQGNATERSNLTGPADLW